MGWVRNGCAGLIMCYYCGVDVTSDVDIIGKLERLRKEFGTVSPSCGDCPGFITKRPKPKLKKRPVPPSQAAERPPKRRAPEAAPPPSGQ